MSVRDALISPFRRHARITLMGALIVLAPLVLLVHSVLRARKALDQAAAPLKQILPGADLSVGGVSGLEVATLVFVVLACWLFGWVIVRTAFGRSIKEWMALPARLPIEGGGVDHREAPLRGVPGRRAPLVAVCRRAHWTCLGTPARQNRPA